MYTKYQQLLIKYGKLSAWKFYSFIASVIDTGDIPLHSNILTNFSKNLKWLQKEYWRPWGKVICERNKKLKISCQTERILYTNSLYIENICKNVCTILQVIIPEVDIQKENKNAPLIFCRVWWTILDCCKFLNILQNLFVFKVICPKTLRSPSHLGLTLAWQNCVGSESGHTQRAKVSRKLYGL